MTSFKAAFWSSWPTSTVYTPFPLYVKTTCLAKHHLLDILFAIKMHEAVCTWQQCACARFITSLFVCKSEDGTYGTHALIYPWGTPHVFLTSCDLMLFIFIRSSKLYLISAADAATFPCMYTSRRGPTSERSIIIQTLDVFYKCVCCFITYAEASVHSKMEKCINIFAERQPVDSSENKSTSARLHANSRAILNGETIDENR